MSIEIKANKQASEHDRALVWVAKAAELNTGTRFFLASVLFIRRNQSYVTAVATDGRRVHIAELGVGYAQGIDAVINERDSTEWIPTKITKRTKTTVTLDGPHKEGRYPDYRRVIPEPTYWVDIDVGHEVQPEFLLSYTLIAVQDAGHRIPRLRTKYVEEVGEMMPNRVGFSAPDKAFLFVTSADDPFERRAVIMPMKRDIAKGES